MTFDESEVHSFLYGTGKKATPRFGTARNRRCDGTLAFMGFLEDNAKRPMHPDQKDNSDWISPVSLHAGAASRTRADIEYMNPFIALDVDTPSWTLARISDRFDGIRCIVHTTTSSTIGHPRWRIIVFLDRAYSADEYGSIWRYFNDMLDGDLDPNTKDASRIMYLPKLWDGAYNYYGNYAGEIMVIDTMLEKFPVVPVTHTQTTKAAAATVTGLGSAAGIEIIQDWMWQREIGNRQGGRMYRILQRAARRFKMLGLNLTATELANDFMARVNSIISPSDPRNHIERDAQNAITWSLANVETLPTTHNIFNWRI